MFQQASRLAAAALLLSSPLVAQGTLYRVVPANVPAGTLFSRGMAMNPQGELAAVSFTSAVPDGIGYADEAAGPRLLQPLPGHASTIPIRFFRNGRAIGFSTDVTFFETRAAVWTPGAAPFPLRVLPGYASSFAIDSNGRSEIVGWCTNALQTSTVPVLWRNGVLERLPLPPGMTDAQAAGITNGGRVVGFGSGGATPPIGFVMEPSGQFQIVQPLPGGLSMLLTHVNQAGVAVGGGDTMGLNVGVRWENGVVTNLGNPAGAVDTILFAINRAGQAVGNGFGMLGPVAAVSVGNQLVDLSTVLDPGSAGWQIFEVNDINNAGQIAGAAMSPIGQIVAVVLDPVKVPLGVTPTPAPPSRRMLPDEARRAVEDGRRLRLGPLAQRR